MKSRQRNNDGLSFKARTKQLNTEFFNLTEKMFDSISAEKFSTIYQKTIQLWIDANFDCKIDFENPVEINNQFFYFHYELLKQIEYLYKYYNTRDDEFIESLHKRVDGKLTFQAFSAFFDHWNLNSINKHTDDLMEFYLMTEHANDIELQIDFLKFHKQIRIYMLKVRKLNIDCKAIEYKYFQGYDISTFSYHYHF